MRIKSKLMLFSACLLILTMGAVSGATAQISPVERQALIMFYDRTGGDLWKANTGWKTPPLAADGFAMPGTEKDWYGVTCDLSNTKVIALQLRQAGLEGESLDDLSSLIHLQTLDLSDNRISTSNYGFLSQLTELRNLYLHQNLFQGSIVPSLAPLVELRMLNLSHNRLEDWDLSAVASLSQLTYLNLGNNRFAGPFPDQLQALPQLQHLDLSNNLLFGPMTLAFGQLTFLDLSNNQLEWDNCDLDTALHLVHLDFHNNRRIGFYPAPINAPQLKYLDMSNTIVGYIPGLEGLAAIETIKLQNCGLSDQPIDPFYGLATLKHLDLSRNSMGRDQELPHINGWTALEYLDLSHNRFSGHGRRDIFDPRQLKYLDLSHNRINADIELGDEVAPQHMDLSYNALEREPLVRNATALQYYDVSHNYLIFDNLHLLNTAPQLKHYDISHNKMSGSTHFPWLGNNAGLTYLDLSHNFFQFYDLDGICDAPSLTYLDLSYNRIEGNIPHRIDNLRALEVLNLTGNRLSGAPSSAIGLLEHLEGLYLGNNHLNIDSLEMYGGLPNLKQLHLEANAMVGEVPRHIIYMQQLERLEIGRNGLHSVDAEVIAFLNAKDPDWTATQTTAPENVTVMQGAPGTLQIRWDPIAFQSGKGGHAVYYAETPDGPFTHYGTTADKTATEMEISGLQPGITYYFKVQTRTAPSAHNHNLVISEDSDIVTGEIPVI